ncbi:UDP-N-acetylmuramate dehydrogenase [Alphaproteobacteria bacterium LSUCC0684]
MTDLLHRLPDVRGTLEPMVPMLRHTWFGVGGVADVMFSPADAEDLAAFLAATPLDIPVFPMGAGSNLLVRDGGIRGVVVNTVTHLNSREVSGDTLIVGAGLHDAECARFAASHGIGGLEFLVGIPGTIGGGLRMNAGAYGVEFRDIVITAEAIDRSGRTHVATPAGMGMAYRHSNAPEDWIFTRATLKAVKGDAASIRARMKEIIANRADAQPRGVRTGGSTFANPDGGKAWQLIDAAGCRGLSLGRAMVSEKHCNFLINNGGASADEIERLGETVRQKVEETSGVALRWEIRRIGEETLDIKGRAE